MDRDHRLEAPNNDSLSEIEQLSDRSNVGAVYRHAHDEWEGVGLMSGKERQEKYDQEQIRINLGIRKWFPIIGLLTPIPFVLMAVMLALAAQYLDMKMAGLVMIPVLLGVVLWAYITYKVVRGVYAIFYNHSIKATPFLVAFVGLLALSYHQLHLFTERYFGEDPLNNVLLVGGVVTTVSIILCGVLLFIWTSRRLSANVKVTFILTFALAIIAVEVSQSFVLPMLLG